MIKDIIIKVKRLLGYTQKAKWYMMLGIFGLALNRLLTTWMIADLLGNGMQAFEDKSIDGLWRAIYLALPWLICVLAVQAISTWLTGVATASAVVSMRGQLMDTMLNSPLGVSQNTLSGAKLSYYTNDIPVALGSLIKTLTAPAGALIMGVAGLAYIMRVHWGMAVVSLIIGIYTYIYSVKFAGWLHKIAVRMQELMAVMESRLKTILDGMVTARMYNMTDKLEAVMGKASKDLMLTGVSWARVSGMLGGMNNSVSYLTDNILIFIAGLLFLGGTLQLPELIRVSQMAGGVVGVFHISRLLVDVQKSLAGAERVFDYMDGAEKETGGDDIAKENSAFAISFENIAFGYNILKPIIQNLSFEIGNGEMIAIMGRSGSGKSTILRLVQGLYKPTGGDIKVLGTSVDRWNLQALRKITSLVPQEPILFPMTIAQNIAIGQDFIDMDTVERAAREAGAHEFISLMQDGYNTMISERGASLSGGQRQRIAIARALYQRAPILLFDEATSAMDAEAEAVVYETLQRLKGKRTILFVTHRASFQNIADRVIVV